MNAKRVAAIAGAIAVGVSTLAINSAHANGRPVLQQLPMPASGNCADVVVPTGVNLSGVDGTGWTRQWGAWENAGRGGFVCGRTLVLNSSTGRYQFQS